MWYIVNLNIVFQSGIIGYIILQWAYGITSWEIFTGGKIPYSELAIREIPKLLAEGCRLEKPQNDACNDEM